MSCVPLPRPYQGAAGLPFGLCGGCAVPAPAQAQGRPRGEATIRLSTEGPSPFVLAGTAPHFGRFACYGEIAFHRGAAEGTLDGVGVAVLQAADGDLIVGVVSC